MEVVLLVWTIIALVMTVLMGGLIAYNGDLIGRKYGKRRLSLFGLRPKHTAILITSVTGVLISALTTGVLFLLVPPVREVILEGEHALAQNVRLAAQNAHLGETNAQLADQNRQAKAEHLKSQQALQSANARLAQSEARYQQTEAQYRQIQKQLERARSLLAGTQTALNRARNQLRLTRAENRKLLTQNASLERQNSDLAAANVDLSDANDRLERRRDELERQNTKLAQYNAELATTNSSLAAQNQKLIRENEDLDKQIANLSRAREALSRTVDVLRGASDVIAATSQRSIQELESRLQELQDSYSALRNRRVVIHGGEDLARTVVPADASPEQVRRIIEELMHQAGLTALARGATPGQGVRAVQVVDREYFAPTPSGGVVPIQVTEADRIDAMVSRLAWSPNSVCLLALAVANTVENEPAAIDLQPFTNRLIFKKGQRLLSRRLDAAQPSEQIFTELVEFLKSAGQSALEQGMIPHIDPATGQPQVGSLGGAELVKLVARIRERGQPVKITALAASDTNAADPLKLDFRIEPSL